MVEGSFSVAVAKEFPKAALKRGFSAATQFALLRVADRLLADSRMFVPVLTGALKDSGFVELLPTFDEAFHFVRVVYPLEYAETQHEDEWRHPSLGFYGAAKYLSKPMELYGSFYLELFTFEFDEYVEKHGLL